MTDRPRALVVSFSDITADARVLRQVAVVARHAHVTTIAYGAQPAGSDEHLRLPDGAKSLPQTLPGVAKLATRRLRSAEMGAPGSQAALRLAAGRSFDVVVANDPRAMPVSFALADGAPVWADLHEWSPEERSHVPVWKLLVAPFMDHLCRTYLPRTAASTTVAGSIAELYEREYSVRPEVMRNAAPWADLSPTPVDGDTIRLVHSGGAVPGRELEAMIDAVQALGDDYSLDLYLVPANDGGKYLAQLKNRAAGHGLITFHDPVAPTALPATLNFYDIGAFWIKPFNTNARYTLPNKLFDFIQARLAIAVGPTVEMQRVVEDHGLGVVSTDFTLDSIVESVRAMTREDIAGFKQAAHAASQGLSFEADAAVADAILERLLRA
ncbi:hypothetical protein [Georgenia sp. SYP-B2076]|uniref:hypothetical protein n=1 Tax=Georgenia sp. SYP-B2076 TaxID=2495881 RepID=UPI000F8D7388|nr:hypothetical protein [Georgenia sp. SYP-B2076]